MNQNDRIKEAQEIAWMFHCWMGFQVTDDIDDKLSLRKLVKKIERDAIKKYKKEQGVKA